MKAARTERDLEEERFEGAFAEELQAAKSRAAAAQHAGVAAAPQPVLTAVPEGAAPARADPLGSTDTRGADPAHLALVADQARQRSADILWVRSNATHAVWCERRPPASGPNHDVICVARIESGTITAQWSFD
jgi:hypothetical protein